MEDDIKRGFKGVWIPRELIEKYGARRACIIQGYKYNAPNLSKAEIREVRSILGCIQLSPTEIKKHIIKKQGDYQCEWCKSWVFVLHSHHYPIRRKDGGKNTVFICPNCHYGYHFLEQFGLINKENIQNGKVRNQSCPA